MITISILNRCTMISHGIGIVCPFKWSKGYVIIKSMTIVIPLVEFDICFLENMSIDHIISVICNSSIWEVILIGDNTTLLDYRYQFIGSLYAMDSKSRTRASSHYYLHRVLKFNWFSLVECWINFKIELRESQHFYGS